MSRTYRESAHTFTRITESGNKNTVNGVYKGDWKSDKKMGLESFNLKKARFIANEKLKNKGIDNV